MSRRTCPVCGGRWVLRLNPGAAHHAWHDDPRCADCRTEVDWKPLEDVASSSASPVSLAAPDLYASLSALLTPAPVDDINLGSPHAGGPAFQEPSRERVCGPCRAPRGEQIARHLDGLVGDLPGRWAADALCAQTDPEIFHPEKGGSTREAKAVCARCPVLTACRDWALETRQDQGVWGGLSWHERRAILRGRRAAS